MSHDDLTMTPTAAYPLDRGAALMIWKGLMNLKVPKTGKARKGKGSPLTAADQLFIADYLKYGDATHAYLAAGFNGNNPGPNSYKMLHKPGIQAFLSTVKERAVEKVAKKLEITVDKVLGDLETARTVALGALPAPQCAAAIKASELQGKHIGMFRDDYADREQAPMIRIVVNSGNGTQIAVVGQDEGLKFPLHVQRTPLLDDVETLTEDDLSPA